MSGAPYWKRIPLLQMTKEQWEALCDGCGRCCLQKLRDEDTGELAFTNVACHLLDRQSCRCSDYCNRQARVSDCIALTPEALADIDWLPPSCAYRLVAEGRDLYWWHPLISGDPETVHTSGASVRGRVVSEHDAGPWEQHIRAWPGRLPSRRRRPPPPPSPSLSGEARPMMTDAIYAGVNAAVLTAMRDDLSVDLDPMAAHCRWLLANGCNGLGVLGTTGEANSLGVSERLAVLDGLAERGIPARRMLPGVGTPAIPDTVLLARKAAEIGCPGVLVLPPFFYKNPTEDGLFAFYSEVVQRTGGAVKVFFYHFPAQSAVPITPALIERLLRAYPGVIKGIKDSSGDFANTKGYVDNFAKDGFEVYCGDDSQLHQLLNIGGAGSISAASNVSSAVNAQVYAGWNTDAGRDAQRLLATLRQAVSGPTLIPGLKALVARNTGDAAWHNIRPPHMRLDDAAQAKLFAAFDACGFVLAR